VAKRQGRQYSAAGVDAWILCGKILGTGTAKEVFLMSEILTRFVRVAASSVWAWLAAFLLQYLGLAFTPDQSLAVEAAMIIILTGLANAAIGLLAKRWPMLESLLLVKVSPKYVEPKR
jgi:hypothetical protein